MEIFAISPATAKPLWFIAVISGILLAVLVLLVYTAYASQNSRVEVGPDRIKLVGDLWGREIPLDQLNVAAGQVVDLSSNSEYAPKHRTLGTGLPGYASGWFRLRNGEKALVYLTQRHDVAYLPTVDGYSLLLSVEEPRTFLRTLSRYSR